MKPHILYYSDCTFFAGCENMIANFLQDPTLKKEFVLSFAYRYTQKYEQGLQQRVLSDDYGKYPLKLIIPILYKKSESQNQTIVYLHLKLFSLFIILCKYYSIALNTYILFKFLKRQNIDILHINNGGFPAAFSCYSAVIAGKLCGIKNIVYVVNNIAQDYSSPMRWLDYPLDQFVKYYVLKFITGSKFAGSKLKEILMLPKDKLIIIPNGIKPREVTLEKDLFVQTYQIPKNRTLISVIANLEKRKGHIYLLEAIKKLCDEIPNRMPIIIFEGDGPENKFLSNYIADNNLEQWVVMYNYIPNIFNLINASDIIILPSIDNEDFPNVVIEGMSLGKPVIGTNIAGIPEQIVHNKTGLVVQPKSAMELETAIKYFVNNPSIIKKFSRNSIIRFNQKFSVEISLSKYKDLYWRLLN